MAKAVIGKARLEMEFAVRRRRVTIHLRGSPQIGSIKRAVFVEHFAVPDGDRSPTRRLAGDTAPADHILAKIKHVHPGFRFA